jgi:aspartate aminotransferase
LPGKHGYMPNAGNISVRTNLANVLSKEHDVPLKANHLVMTVGAAGALNVALKAIINAGETVLIFAPYFVEYRFYIDNVNGKCQVVETDAEFDLDIDAIRSAMNPSVKAMIINTPNNPTGRVYSEETLNELGKFVDQKAAEYGHPIYILSDEPYRKIIYHGVKVPSMFHISPNTIVCSSFSKELAIPGERLGYVAVNPACQWAAQLTNAFTFCNRILGFVNAPALMQRALAYEPDVCVDIAMYEENRELFLNSLLEMGYQIVPPDGAFYLFPKSPVEDEITFVSELKKELILVVPGRGFGRKGYFRIAFCVTKEVIEKSLPGFKRAIDRLR